MKIVQSFEIATRFGPLTVKAEIVVTSPSWAVGAEAQAHLKEIKNKLHDALFTEDLP